MAFIFILGCTEDDSSPTEPANSAPVAPFNPSQANNSTDQPIEVTLSWSCSDPDGDTLTYSVYLGTSDDPPLVSDGQADTLYNPGVLDPAEGYYWKIVAKDDHDNSTEGSLLSFATIPEINLPPNLPGNLTPNYWNESQDGYMIPLRWTCTDPENDPLTFDLYLNHRLIREGLTEKSYRTVSIPGSTMYWKVVAKDDHGNSTEGELWFVAIR